MHEAEKPVDARPRMVYFFGPGACEGDPERKDILGGKGASLVALARVGLPVPPGFTISIGCCGVYYQAGGTWPAGLEEQVRANMVRLEKATGKRFGQGSDPLLVSVRSGAAVSMPGMLDTILNCGLHPGLEHEVADEAHFWSVYGRFVEQFGRTVAHIAGPAFREAAASRTGRPLAEAYIRLYERVTGRPFPVTPWDALRECINAVFDSWGNERAKVYRAAHGLEGLAGTAVSVQAMFGSQVSGIAFTANPARPSADEIVVESSYGLGESVVSGDVTPDRFVLDRSPLRLKDRALGRKESVMSALPQGGASAALDASAASLTDAQVVELAQLALRVERHFGFPVDVEWGLADGKFALLQARPIRGLDAARNVEACRRGEIARLKALATGAAKVWTIHNLAETLEAPTPLTWDVIRQFMSGEGGFGLMYRDLGYLPSRRVRQEGFLELIGGRIYVDVDRAAELFWEGMPFQYDHHEVLANPRLLESAPTRFEAGRADGAFLLRLPRALLAMLRCNSTMRKARRRALQAFEKVALPPFLAYVGEQRRRDLSGLSTREIVGEVHGQIRRVLSDFGKESLKPGFFGGCARAELEAVLVQLMGRIEGEKLCQVLTSGLDGDPTVEQNAMLFQVSQGKATLEEFLERYGHRAVGEMELARPRWREDPSYLLQVIASQKTTEDHSPEFLHKANEAGRRQAMADLRQTLARWGGSFLYERVESLAREVQALMPHRETGKNYLLMGYELIRAVIVELATRWDLGDGVFFLHLDELERFETESAALKAEIEGRRAMWQAAQRLDLPAVIDSANLDELGLPRQFAAAQRLEALSLSPGVVVGTARILRHPDEAKDLGDDCVLICPSTDPSWTALFTTIKGLVVERGGVLSHGAITARDFSIPAVACPDATMLIKEGARVRVDGDNGHVMIVQEQ
jgi:pyruvate,water dikinase